MSIVKSSRSPVQTTQSRAMEKSGEATTRNEQSVSATAGKSHSQATRDSYEKAPRRLLPGQVGSPPMGASSGDTGKNKWLGDLMKAPLVWEAITGMARTPVDVNKNAADIKQSAHEQTLAGKHAALDAVADKIQGQRDAAADSLVTACVSSALSIASSVVGCLGSSASGGLGQQIMADLQSGRVDKAKVGLQQAIARNPVFEQRFVIGMAERLGGSDPSTKAGEKRLEAKRYEPQEGVLDEAIDQAKEDHEGSKDQFKLAIRLLSEHMERQTQVIQKITD